ncbi:aspartate dehydrogenase [Infirmifilum lucidum]|uniref:L-aspartate dehydrogenase n=1 Tax=Infirmifilum lucidum TaxID=2776706 RepID=A0A7L9FGF2_9CREN|nr:aspartate dehydrogenase [Infirmifilum lucidum]QOJ78701.1 aspartate dehydrogenase [Infirmifilum lucidum]
MKRVAIIGCGAIGGVIARSIDRGDVDAELVSLMDTQPEACTKLRESFTRQKPSVATSIEEVLSLRPDIVVEAASQEAVGQYAERVLEFSDLVVLSVGALLDAEVYQKIVEVTARTGKRIYIPSGAIGGLDVLRAYARAGVSRLRLTTRKPARALGATVTTPTVVFRGKASQAVKAYPKSLNVAATISLAAGVEAEVELIADPNTDRNIHEIEAESPAGRLRIVLENVPSPENPRTSYLAALSAVTLLQELCSPKRALAFY